MEDNKIYVDKTKLIYELLIKGKQTALVINGPRKTGKSLLLSTIQTMYTQNVVWWNNYASDLWVTKNKSSFFSKEPYPIVRFSFGTCKSDNDFKLDIIKALNKVITLYEMKTREISEKISWEELIGIRVDEVMDDLNLKFKKKIVILVDEYDQPLINQLFLLVEQDTLEMRMSIEKTIKSMSKFYTKIKELSATQLEITVICGNSNIAAQTSFDSGYKNNIMKDII